MMKMCLLFYLLKTLLLQITHHPDYEIEIKYRLQYRKTSINTKLSPNINLGLIAPLNNDNCIEGEYCTSSTTPASQIEKKICSEMAVETSDIRKFVFNILTINPYAPNEYQCLKMAGNKNYLFIGITEFDPAASCTENCGKVMLVQSKINTDCADNVGYTGYDGTILMKFKLKKIDFNYYTWAIELKDNPKYYLSFISTTAEDGTITYSPALNYYENFNSLPESAIFMFPWCSVVGTQGECYTPYEIGRPQNQGKRILIRTNQQCQVNMGDCGVQTNPTYMYLQYNNNNAIEFDVTSDGKTVKSNYIFYLAKNESLTLNQRRFATFFRRDPVIIKGFKISPEGNNIAFDVLLGTVKWPNTGENLFFQECENVSGIRGFRTYKIYDKDSNYIFRVGTSKEANSSPNDKFGLCYEILVENVNINNEPN